MVSDIEFLETICERMQQVGLVQSKADFSTNMLGKGPSYLTSMSARDRKVPEEVMASLAGQLQNDIADDDAALSRLNAEVERHQHQRKHRTDMLECVTRHGAEEPRVEPQRQQVPVVPSSFRQRLVGWLSCGRAAMP